MIVIVPPDHYSTWLQAELGTPDWNLWRDQNRTLYCDNDAAVAARTKQRRERRTTQRSAKNPPLAFPIFRAPAS